MTGNSISADQQADEEFTYADSWLLKHLARNTVTMPMQLERVGNLEDEIAYFRKLLNSHPEGDPARPTFLNYTAEAIYIRFLLSNVMEDFNEAVVLFKQAYRYSPDDPASYFPASNLATACFARFLQSDKDEDLNDAITYHRCALAHRSPGHPDHFSSLYDLLAVVAIRAKRFSKKEDLEEDVRCRRQLGITPVFTSTPSNADLAEEAIVTLQKALIFRPPGHPGRSSFFHSLGYQIFLRFKYLDRMEDLHEAINHLHDALSLRPDGHPNRSSSLHTLGTILFTRFERMGRPEDLEDAITFMREALALRIPGHPYRPESLDNLATALSSSFEQFNRIEDLEDAIAYHREVLTLYSPEQLSKSHTLNNLGLALRNRFKNFGEKEDLEEGIMYQRRARDLHASDHDPVALYNFGASLSIRFDLLGRMEDLEEAISCFHQAFVQNPNQLDIHEHLGNAFFRRFMHLGRMDDLEESINSLRQALYLYPDNVFLLNGIATVFFTRSKEWGEMEAPEEACKDLKEASKYYMQGLDLLSPDHTARATFLHHIAATIFHRFKQSGKIADLDEAITNLGQALAHHPPDAPVRFYVLDILAQAVAARFQELGRTEDFEEALQHFTDAEKALPVQHPFHAKILTHLASAYLTRPDHISMATTLFKNAASQSTASPKDRLFAALQWASVAHNKSHESAVCAYFEVFNLLDRCLLANPTVETQHRFLLSVPSSLACAAAASAIEAGKLEAAVELLERGRTLIWSKMHGYRGSLERLREVDSQLADRFQDLSRQLECFAISSDLESQLPAKDSHIANVALFDTKMRMNRSIQVEWESVVEEIRQKDGFTNFQQVIPFTTLQTAAAEGPVIIINFSMYRSDALIIYGSRRPELVPLVTIVPDTIELLPKKLSEALKSQKELRKILRGLWDMIVNPVVEQLAAMGVAENSRIWWCPTSELCALPLHAAGPYRNGQKNLVDIYISSYIPTLSSLIRARSSPHHTAPNLLAIGQPGDNLDDRKLGAVREEIRRIHNLGDFVNVLVAGEANQQSVLSALQQHTWVHFACHGHQDKQQPFDSSFELWDGRLTLVDLMGAQLPHAEFAFLAACHSAAGGNNTPDEIIHLAAALQFCGFRSVIGTLWEMVDIDGPDVAEDFYKYMFSASSGTIDFRDAAMALHQATKVMRGRKGMTVGRWINYVHIGA